MDYGTLLIDCVGMRYVQEELIATRERVATSEPVDIFSLEQPADYDKVSVTGRFLHEYSLYVGPRPRR